MQIIQKKAPRGLKGEAATAFNFNWLFSSEYHESTVPFTVPFCDYLTLFNNIWQKIQSTINPVFMRSTALDETGQNQARHNNR